MTETALRRKLEQFARLNGDELAGLAELEASPRMVPARTELVHEGQRGAQAFIVQSGWACAYKLLPDGGRQVIDFPIASDFMGVRSMLLQASDHSFAAVTDLVVAEVSAARIMSVFTDLPRLGCAILWASSRDEAMVVEHLVAGSAAARP